MDVFVTTVGCRLNQFDSDALERAAAEAGHRVVRDPALAELHLVNTCTITHQADADSRQLIRRAQRQSPGSQVVVTGCWATAEPHKAAGMPGVVHVEGNAGKAELWQNLAARASETGASPGSVDVPLTALHSRAQERSLPVADLEPALHPDRSRAYLKIQDGCDYKCSFCIVPRVRGPSRSLEPATLARQLAELVHAGQREITLTGVHLGTWGRDLPGRPSFASLTANLAAQTRALAGLVGSPVRLRLGSLDPHEVDEALISLLIDYDDVLCRYLHLPVQSGHDAVLRAMRRAHTVEDFVRTTQRLVDRIPGIALGSDVIAGFPGETPEQAATTLEVLGAAPLSYLHVFTYSDREGTDAVDLPHPVDPAERKARTRALRELSDRMNTGFVESQLGCALPGFVLHHRDPTGRLIALTDNYLKISFEGEDTLMGSWVSVEVQEPGVRGIHPGRLL